MPDHIHILILEDSVDDAELVLLNLEHHGIQAEFKRVETKDAFIAALDDNPDLIISDYSLPKFDALSALKIARERGMDVPFIFISGTFGEEVVAGALDLGANDFLMKDRMAGLSASVRRVIEQKRLREEKQQSDAALFESERRLRSMMESMHLISIMLDVEGNITFCNDYLLNLTGWKKDEVFGKNWFDIFIPENEGDIKQRFEEAIKKDHLSPYYEHPIRTKTGEQRNIDWNNCILRDVNGEIIGIASIGEDITERKRAEDKIFFQAKLLDAVGSAVIATDLDGIVQYWNPAAEKLYGWSSSEAVGKNIVDLTPALMSKEKAKEIMAQLANGNPWSGEFLVQKKDGSTFPASVSDTPIMGPDGRLIGIVGISEDITERKQAEETLIHMSIHDSLTGLYNRGYFVEEMERLERGRGFPVSIVMADVDYLKDVNDKMGHAAGDALLKQVADVLTTAFRAEDVIARLGGDEFAVLLPDTDEVTAKESLQRVQQVIQEKNNSRNEPRVSISFGVSTADKPTSLTHLLNEADENLYRKKRTRDNN